MKFAAFAAAAAGLILSGCSTIFGPPEQTIALSTPPVDGAHCVLSNKDGTWTVTTPDKAKVTSEDDLQVRCTKKGWEDASTSISADFDIWSLDDSYPEKVEVPMTPMPRATAPDFGPSSAPAAPYNPGLSPG
jgi:hypothetical protein